MAAGLVVHADPVGPGLGKGGDEFVGVLDHQVAVERQVGGLAQALDHRRPDGDVGHEMAVHHVHVDDRAAAPLGRGNLIGQMGKIRRQDGWQQLNHRVLCSVLHRGQCISRVSRCIGFGGHRIGDGASSHAAQEVEAPAACRALEAVNMFAARVPPRAAALSPASPSASGKKISPVRRASGRIIPALQQRQMGLADCADEVPRLESQFCQQLLPCGLRALRGRTLIDAADTVIRSRLPGPVQRSQG